MTIPRGAARAALLLATLSLLLAPRAQAEWSTVLLTKDLVDKGESIGAYRSVWGTSPASVYAAGAGGIIHFDGKKWTREAVTLPPHSRFAGIWGTTPLVRSYGHLGPHRHLDESGCDQVRSRLGTLIREQ